MKNKQLKKRGYTFTDEELPEQITKPPEKYFEF
jgi:hypothetical protein